MQTDQSFLPLHGNYRNLVVYQKQSVYMILPIILRTIF